MTDREFDNPADTKKYAFLLRNFISEKIINNIFKYCFCYGFKFVNPDQVVPMVEMSKKKLKNMQRLKMKTTGKEYTQQERINKINDIKLELSTVDAIQYTMSNAQVVALFKLYQLPKLTMDIVKEIDLPIIQHHLIIKLYRSKGEKSFVNLRPYPQLRNKDLDDSDDSDNESYFRMTPECKKFLLHMQNIRKTDPGYGKKPTRI